MKNDIANLQGSINLLNEIVLDRGNGEIREERRRITFNLPHKFPCKTIEEFENFNYLLEDNEEVRKQFENFLLSIGGKNPEKITRAALNCTLSNEVVCAYNWTGTKGGIKMSDKHFAKVFLDVNSSPSKMLLPMQRIKTGSLACWVLLIIIADLTDARVIFFKFRYDIRLYIRNYGKTVEDFVIFGNFFLQTASDITKPFAAQMYGIEILRSDRYGKNQSITNCTSFDDTIKALSMPFSVIYSEFFVIKGLKFNKDDTVFSKNLKFDFMTNNVQLNLSKILEHKDREFTDYSNETTIMGLCELKYDVKSYPESEDISFDGIKKTYTGVCEETMSPDNQYTLGNICSTGKMKNFRVKVTNECCIKLNQGMSTIMYTRLKHQRSFRPWKSSQRVLVAEYTIKMDYQYTLRRDLLPELQDATNELVDKPILTKPNPEVLKIKNSNLSNLVEDARALGCDASFETGTRELVEEVLKCYLPK